MYKLSQMRRVPLPPSLQTHSPLYGGLNEEGEREGVEEDQEGCREGGRGGEGGCGDISPSRYMS